ncbi:hypothetical protein D3C84_643340 [compost metagenome]
MAQRKTRSGRQSRAVGPRPAPVTATAETQSLGHRCAGQQPVVAGDAQRAGDPADVDGDPALRLRLGNHDPRCRHLYRRHSGAGCVAGPAWLQCADRGDDPRQWRCRTEHRKRPPGLGRLAGGRATGLRRFAAPAAHAVLPVALEDRANGAAPGFEPARLRAVARTLDAHQRAPRCQRCGTGATAPRGKRCHRAAKRRRAVGRHRTGRPTPVATAIAEKRQ